MEQVIAQMHYIGDEDEDQDLPQAACHTRDRSMPPAPTEVKFSPEQQIWESWDHTRAPDMPLLQMRERYNHLGEIAQLDIDFPWWSRIHAGGLP